MPQDVLDREEVKLRQVLAWRIESFMKLGFTIDQAEILAFCADVDVRQAEKLVQQGCSLDLAVQILL